MRHRWNIATKDINYLFRLSFPKIYRFMARFNLFHYSSKISKQSTQNQKDYKHNKVFSALLPHAPFIQKKKKKDQIKQTKRVSALLPSMYFNLLEDFSWWNIMHLSLQTFRSWYNSKYRLIEFLQLRLISFHFNYLLYRYFDIFIYESIWN